MNTQKTVGQKHCPNCGSARVHRSHRKGRLEKAVALFGAEVRRCHDCRSRHAWLRSLAVPLPGQNAGDGRLTSLALMGSTFLMCFLFLMWMISRFTELAG